MSNPLPPLAAIRCFEAAARLGNLTRAADELGMTQAAVSYQIKLLEERIGQPVFLRGPRGVMLTEAGQRLSPLVTEAFTSLRQAFDGLRETDEGVLSITSISTFATNWLVPRLGEFQLRHPDIAVKLSVSGHLVDLLREGVDIGIRSGAGEWPGLESHWLMGIEYAPLVSPALAARVPLETPADLLKLPIIDPGDIWWPTWFAEAGVPAPDLKQRSEIAIGEQLLTGSAALSGQGVSILMPKLFARDIAAGRLIQPFPILGRDSSSYWIVYPEARKRSAKIRAFRDWLLGAIDAPG